MDCREFAACAELDPVFADALRRSANSGVEVLCYDCHISSQAITVARPLPWRDRP
jgi:sugar fermentation stimulation protein A